MCPFDTLDYLATGNERQRKAYFTLSGTIFPFLKKYDPVLVGTIPLGIDIESSDLDVLCYVTDLIEFSENLIKRFGELEGFTLSEMQIDSTPVVIASFFCGGFEIEVFGKNTPVQQQSGYRHMIIEDAILQREDEFFREKIIRLKKQGVKTEPAFAQLLGLAGNPYDALLEYGKTLAFICV